MSAPGEGPGEGEGPGMALDWGDGDYARTAAVLEPASEVVVELAGISEGDRVLDVACGTGNAVVAAARRGARVVGVDLSEGLVATARRRVEEAGLAGVELRAADAVDLPVEPGSFDVAISVFGVIFVSDAAAAVAGMRSAVRPGGTIAIASWAGRGPVHDAGAALRSAFPREADALTFDWDRPDRILDLLARAGLRDIAQHEGSVGFHAASPEEWFAEHEEHHPVWRWARRLLAPERWEAVRRESVHALRAGSDDPVEFRGRNPYVVTTAVR